MIDAIVRSMRPKQWTKNGVVFAGLIFSRSLGQPQMVLRAVAAVAIFCLLSGSVYLINDIKDIDKDRRHPTKCKRPLPSGALSVAQAWGAAIVLAAGSLAAAFALNPKFGALAAGYVALVSAYSFGLKNVVVVDVFAIALGFVLRAVAGVEALALEGSSIELSPWLLICTFLLATFLALAKRRNEISSFEKEGKVAAAHRAVLDEYTLPLLDQMTAAVSSATIVAYALYTFDERTVQSFGSAALAATTPFVMYGIFRYMYLVHRRQMGGNPETIFLTDRGILTCVLLWILSAGAIIYLV
ncbi:MAG: decaprenyl-phosphate phosphoribosyltransferase [Gemmatimonadetes bacterium]|nr:decaprenyl-phosphate phosphoribosyltransferase [Gemmatimonadota bacterium]